MEEFGAMDFRETINRYFDAIARRDRSAFLDTFSDQPGLLHHDPVGTPPRTTPEEIGAFWDQIMALFESVTLAPEELFPGGSHVALTWNGRGKGRNGAEVTFRGIDVFVADDQGRILELRAYWDMAPTLALLMGASA